MTNTITNTWTTEEKEEIEGQFRAILDILNSSHKNAQKFVRERLDRLYREYKKADSQESFLKSVDTMSTTDIGLFSLFYFPQTLSDGFQEFEPEFFTSCDEIHNKSCPYDKLVLTGYRGCGKTQIQTLTIVRNMTYEIRMCVCPVAITDTKARENTVSILNHWLSLRDDDEPSLFTKRWGYLVSRSQGSKKDMDKTFTAFQPKSVGTGFSLVNGTYIKPRSVGQNIRGLKSPILKRVDMIVPDDFEDYDTPGSKDEETIWRMLNAGFNSDSRDDDRHIITIASGNYIVYSNIHKLHDWSKDPKKRTKFLAVDLLNEEKRESNDKNLTYDEAVDKCLSSDTPEEMRNRPDIGAVSRINISRISIVPSSELNTDAMFTILSIDPAFTRTRWSDFSGITWIHIDRYGGLYGGGEKVALNTTELMSYVTGLIKPLSVGLLLIEGGGTNTAFAQMLSDYVFKLPDISVPVHVAPIKRNSAGRPHSKIERIWALKDILESGELKLIKEESQEILTQLNNFTKKTEPTRADKKGFDVIDSLAQGVAYIRENNIWGATRNSERSYPSPDLEKMNSTSLRW